MTLACAVAGIDFTLSKMKSFGGLHLGIALEQTSSQSLSHAEPR